MPASAFASRNRRLCSAREHTRLIGGGPVEGGGSANSTTTTDLVVGAVVSAERQRVGVPRRGGLLVAGGDGGDGGEQAQLLVEVFQLVELGVGARQRLVGGVRLAQAVAALVGDLEGPGPQPRVVGDEQVRLLVLARPGVQRTKRPTAWRKNSSVVVVVAYTPTRSRGMSTPSDTMRTATSHGSLAAAKRAMSRRRVGSSDGDHGRPLAEAVAQEAGDAAGVVLVDGDDQAAGLGVRRRGSARGGRPPSRSTVGSHSPVERERGAQPLARPGLVEGVVERWPTLSVPSGAVHSISPPVRGK